MGKLAFENFFDLFLLCKKSNETFYVIFKLSEMPSAKDVKFAIFPFYFCVFFKVCTRTKNKDLHENKKKQRFTKKKPILPKNG